MATITRQLTPTDPVTRVGDAVHMALAAGGDSAELQWTESCTDIAVGPQVADQIFRMVHPAITGTTRYSSVHLYVLYAGVSITFTTTNMVMFPPTMSIYDGQGARDEPFDPATQSWVRCQTDGVTVTMSVGPDGFAWTEVAAGNHPGYPDFGNGPTLDQLTFVMYLALNDGTLPADPPDPATGIIDSWLPALPAFGTTTYDVFPDDPFNPDASAPAVDAACSTLLDLIRAFSGAVRRSVRLTGPTSIEMVDPNLPLPATYTAADADDMYHATTHKLTAGAEVLSMLAGDLDLQVTASLVSNDVRLITSDWRIPNRLPVYGVDPAPVQRISHTFTPDGYSASVEFYVPSIPLALRRT